MFHEQGTIFPGLRVVAIGGGQVLLDEPASYDDTELRAFPIPRDRKAGLLVDSNDNPHAKSAQTLFTTHTSAHPKGLCVHERVLI